MRVPDSNLDEVRTQGYTILPGFLGADELAAAQECLWANYPRPADYFADPAAPEHQPFSRSQFAGLRVLPFVGWDLNRLCVHDDLVEAMERYLGTDDLQLYKCELWAKYAGAIDYDQPLHRDFGNHSLVVPRDDGYATQLTTFILLSDVTLEDGPTHVVPYEAGRHVPYIPFEAEPRPFDPAARAEFARAETPITGPAGTLFIYRTDILHRGSQITGACHSRFAMLVDFQARGPQWTGKVAWGNQALSPHWRELMERCTPRQRDLFGFPRPGDPYWNPQTLAGVQSRYPAMDMTPYRSP